MATPVDENCKFVVRLSTGDYIYNFDLKRAYLCKSRLRARQFTSEQSRRLLIAFPQSTRLKATWEREL